MSLFGKKKPTKKILRSIKATRYTKNKVKTAQSKSAATAVSHTGVVRAHSSVRKPKAPKQPKAVKATASASQTTKAIKKKTFPDLFPFWARLKISKKRTTLVIDETQAVDKKQKKW